MTAADFAALFGNSPEEMIDPSSHDNFFYTEEDGLQLLYHLLLPCVGCSRLRATIVNSLRVVARHDVDLRTVHIGPLKEPPQ